MRSGMFGNAVSISHQVIARVVQPGDTVVDATCGRGKDTLFLAQLVGSRGRVYAFDIQDEALKSTRELLNKNKCLNQAVLINANHSQMASYVEGHPSACMFNLGYLPGGDHSLITNSKDTLRALSDCITLLAPQGIVSLVFYPGHPGGQEEMESIEKFLSGLPQQLFEVIRASFLNQINCPPQIICIEKLGGGQL
ncbi:class I SAM-dependent methyltransferase [Syntrophomonas curvata]